MSQSKEFSGKTALITGASKGIGAESAIALARQGADVLIHYNSDEASAQQVQSQAAALGVKAELLQAELGTREGIKRLAGMIKNRRIDFLINNAGSLVERTKVMDFTEELWDRVFTLNLNSAFFLSQAVIPGMIERGGGVIINMTSIAARNGGGVGAIAYASAKAAMSNMTRGFTKEFAAQGIRANAIAPGTILTHFHEVFSNEQMLTAMKASAPAGRLGDSDDVSGVVVFLCSDAAKYIHGQVIEVNGGMLMP